MKKWLIPLLFLATLLCGCRQQPTSVEIPALDYTQSTRSYRVAEQFHPDLFFGETTLDYQSPYAIYHFDADVAPAERDTCVYYSDLVLSRLALENPPEILILAGYSGAWTDGALLYLGAGDFSSAGHAAKLITLALGEFVSYGGAYGYAAYLLDLPAEEFPPLADCAARDLNWLCFREGFVPPEEIEANRAAACQFIRDCIASQGEAAYLDLLRQSGDPATVSAYNAVLSDWYAQQGLTYTPSEVLYSFGGQYHDYLIRHSCATMYMAADWENQWRSSLVRNDRFLHESYETIKAFFELSQRQMTTLQDAVGFDKDYGPITVSFPGETQSSYCLPYAAQMVIGSVEDLCHEYAHYLITPLTRPREDAQVTQYLAETLVDYLAITIDNPYYTAWLEYARENGLPTKAAQFGDFNELYKTITAGVTDPYTLWKVRMDLHSYYFEDYRITGLGVCSFPIYLMETLSYDAFYHYILQTGEEPPALDLNQLRQDWENTLRETYGACPTFRSHPDFSEETLQSLLP